MKLRGDLTQGLELSKEKKSWDRVGSRVSITAKPEKEQKRDQGEQCRPKATTQPGTPLSQEITVGLLFETILQPTAHGCKEL